MSESEQYVRSLYARGQELRDRKWRAYEQNLARVLASLESEEGFLRDFEHLVPVDEPAPLDVEPQQQVREEPPPLPVRGGPEAFKATFGRYPGEVE